MRDDYDVVVIGGGSAGVNAAIQAGRAGARTLLVEKNGMLGGTTTVAGVNAPALFGAWGELVIAGIGWELMNRVHAEGGCRLPDFKVPGRMQNSHAVFVSVPLYAAVLDEAVNESGCELLLHAMLGEVRRAGGEWKLTLCTKRGLKRVSCAAVVDATADANVVEMAGLPVRRNGWKQPGTLLFKLSGYDKATVDVEMVQKAFDAECAAGRLRASDAGWNEGSIKRLLEVAGYNTIHVCDVDGSDSEGRTLTEVKARRIMLELYRFLRKLPGLEGVKIDSVSPECGVRETCTIEGRATVTLEDYWSGRVWDDAVCHSFYPIDLHTDAGLDYRALPQGVLPTIPRGAMLPVGGEFIAAPGRHMSSDQLANSALRVQATCMAAGQAAGGMAALAAARGVDLGELPMADVRTLLREHGAIVPEPAAVAAVAAVAG